jgi:hypothetical protein
VGLGGSLVVGGSKGVDNGDINETTFPREQGLQLSASQFRIVTRARLHVPPLNIMPSKCRMCGESLADPIGRYHGLHCNNQKRIHGHNRIVQALKQVVTDAGGFANPNISACHNWPDGRVPDLEVFLGDQTHLIDVTVVNPLAPTYYQRAAKSHGSGAIAKEAEQKKINKYEQLAKTQGAIFHPFALEALGTFGEEAKKFLELLALHHEEHVQDGLTKRHFMSTAISRIAAALHRRNAECVLRSLRRPGWLED